MEQRKFQRRPFEADATCFLADDSGRRLTNEKIPARMENVSQGGVRLTWPTWWKCKDCIYYRPGKKKPRCALKKCIYQGMHEYLIKATIIEFAIEVPNGQPIRTFGRVVWVKEPLDQHDKCVLGVSFTERKIDF